MTMIHVAPAAPAESSETSGQLSAEELHRLTLFKWRYTLKGMGFQPTQIDELVFLAWLRASHRLEP